MNAMHLVFTEYPGFGWSLRSPQLPGLVAGRDTGDELLRDLDFIMEFAGERGAHDFDLSQVNTHEEHAFVDPEGNEYLVRVQTDTPENEDRYRLGSQIGAATLEGIWGAEGRKKQPELATGERLLIAAAPTDTLGWVRDQLDANDTATLMFETDQIRGRAVWNMPFGQEGLGEEGVSLDALGLSDKSTLSEALTAIMGVDHSVLRTALPEDFGAFERQLTRV